LDKEYKNIKVIGFDADDTLWVNETYFRAAEERIGDLLSRYETPNKIDQELFKMVIKNLSTYGYGIKGFTLSMIELAVEISNYEVSNKVIDEIIAIGKEMLNKPVELLENVERVLTLLSKQYKLIVATKGDLLDQERKLEKSGLLKYFHHIEVLSDKKEENYVKLLAHLEIKPEQFLMIGNSLKSDVLPLINIKAKAIHVPFHTTWAHEIVKEEEKTNKKYKIVNNLKSVLELLI